MIIYLKSNAWGYAVARFENGKDYYISKVHRDGTYDFTGDYTLAKRWKNEEIAEKHLKILKRRKKLGGDLE